MSPGKSSLNRLAGSETEDENFLSTEANPSSLISLFPDMIFFTIIIISGSLRDSGVPVHC